MSFELPLSPLLGAGLAFVRLLAFVLTAPFFGNTAIPLRARIALAVLFAAAVAPGLPAPHPPALEPDALALAALGEALVGVCVGITAWIVLAALGIAAELISVQGGIGAAALFDPTSGAASPALGLLAQSTALVVFLAVGGHHVLLEAAAHSFALLPAGGAGIVEAVRHSAALGGFVFATGLRLAAPFTAALLLSNLTVGALGRLIPQLNLMSVQLPAQIAISLALLAVCATPLVDVLAGLLRGGQAELLQHVLGGAP
jgi:flagellar biosynthetic protein FliR